MKGLAVFFFVVYAAFAHVDAGKKCINRSNAIGVDECPREQETDWTIEYLMRHEVCNMFYQCTHGHPVERYCFGDLWFNLDTWQCDWPHNVDCADRIIPTTTTTTTSTTPGPTPEPTTTTTTLAPTTTTTTPPPTTTTTTTTTTTPPPTTTTTTTTTTTPPPTTTTTTTTTPPPTTTTTTTTTPPPTTTTTTTTTPPPTTTTTTTTTPPPTTTTTTTTTPPPTTTTQATTTEGEMEFLPNGCPVDPHIHWLLPHEYDCNLFYYCVWGQLALRNCPSALHFNTRIQVCDWPNAAGCTLPGRPS